MFQNPTFLVLLKKQLVLRVGFPVYGFLGNSERDVYIEGRARVLPGARSLCANSYLLPIVLSSMIGNNVPSDGGRAYSFRCFLPAPSFATR